MRARELFQAGQLDAAIDALGVEVRDNPTDTQRRTFLFELLCFAGQYGRANPEPRRRPNQDLFGGGM